MRSSLPVVILCCTALVFTDRALAQTDFWEPAGAEALDVQALFVDANDDIYVATFTDGMYRSTDNGDTWTQVNNGLTNLLTRTVTVSGTGHVLVGTDFGGAFRSTDSGGNWTEVNNGLLNLGVNILTVNSAGDIFAGTQAGLFRSTDGADSWTLVFEGSGSFIRVITIDPTSERIFAAGHTTVSRIFAWSDDNGDTWTFMADFGDANSNVQALNIDSNGDVYAGLSFSGIYRSDDSGSNWTEVNTGVPAFAEIRSIMSDGKGDVYAAVQQSGVLVSSNSGANWSAVNSGLPVSALLGSSQALGVNSKQDLFLGTSQGVFRHETTSTSVEEGANDFSLTASLQQNYPNPFNVTTIISYTLPQNADVKLTVSDILGRSVRVLASGMSPPGYSEVAFDASSLPSGTYFYRLETKDFDQSKRMVVVR